MSQISDYIEDLYNSISEDIVLPISEDSVQDAIGRVNNFDIKDMKSLFVILSALNLLNATIRIDDLKSALYFNYVKSNVSKVADFVISNHDKFEEVSVYYDKSVTIAFPEYYQLLLEDYTIYHEYYNDDDDFYDYDTKGSIQFLDDQDDDMSKSSLTVKIPTVREISKQTGEYTILEGDYYFKIYKLDYEYFYYGLHNFMDNVNPQIFKSFYIEKISNIKDKEFTVKFNNFSTLVKMIIIYLI